MDKKCVFQRHNNEKGYHAQPVPILKKQTFNYDTNRQSKCRKFNCQK